LTHHNSNSTYRASLQETEDEITEQTAGRELGELVKVGLLTAMGKARGRFYTAGQELIAVRRPIIDSRDPRDDSDPFTD
jgi:hypothetical protein